MRAPSTTSGKIQGMNSPSHLEPVTVPPGRAFVGCGEVPVEQFDVRRVARLYDVPPWVVSGGIPVPRFPRLRWMLRRVWPV